VDPKGDLPGRGKVAELADSVGSDGVVRRDEFVIDRD
jgi:hypothetical protein